MGLIHGDASYRLHSCISSIGTTMVGVVGSGGNKNGSNSSLLQSTMVVVMMRTIGMMAPATS